MTWTKTSEQLQPLHHYVLLLADRYWSVPEGMPDMKVAAVGYLSNTGGGDHWSVFGEYGARLGAFPYWVSIHDEMTTGVEE